MLATNSISFTAEMLNCFSRIIMKCPNCEKPTVWQDNPFRPFCSERCKLIDFGNWADENYAVPDESLLNSEDALEGAAIDDQLVRYDGEIRDA